MKRVILLFVAALVMTAPPDIYGQDPDFSSWWHDGKAELSGYKLTVSRYGEEREGTCVMIYVTEPFSESKRVKVDDHTRNPDDTVDVLKLNMVRDFQTGIYDYNMMTSVFVRSSDFSPVKVTFSAAEWCGHVYDEQIFLEDKVEGRYSSYFEDESGEYEVPGDARRAVLEDGLFIALRGLRGEFLKPGQSRRFNLLPGTYARRMGHTAAMTWYAAQISRPDEVRTITVPAGTFDTIVYAIQVGKRAGTFHVEKEYPHRIIRWGLAPDIRGELTGTVRLPYWELNKNGDESYLEKLGL